MGPILTRVLVSEKGRQEGECQINLKMLALKMEKGAMNQEMQVRKHKEMGSS